VAFYRACAPVRNLLGHVQPRAVHLHDAFEGTDDLIIQSARRPSKARASPGRRRERWGAPAAPAGAQGKFLQLERARVGEACRAASDSSRKLRGPCRQPCRASTVRRLSESSNGSANDASKEQALIESSGGAVSAKRLVTSDGGAGKLSGDSARNRFICAALSFGSGSVGIGAHWPSRPLTARALLERARQPRPARAHNTGAAGAA